MANKCEICGTEEDKYSKLHRCVVCGKLVCSDCRDYVKSFGADEALYLDENYAITTGNYPHEEDTTYVVCSEHADMMTEQQKIYNNKVYDLIEEFNDKLFELDMKFRKGQLSE